MSSSITDADTSVSIQSMTTNFYISRRITFLWPHTQNNISSRMSPKCVDGILIHTTSSQVEESKSKFVRMHLRYPSNRTHNQSSFISQCKPQHNINVTNQRRKSQTFRIFWSIEIRNLRALEMNRSALISLLPLILLLLLYCCWWWWGRSLR